MQTYAPVAVAKKGPFCRAFILAQAPETDNDSAIFSGTFLIRPDPCGVLAGPGFLM